MLKLDKVECINYSWIVLKFMRIIKNLCNWVYSSVIDEMRIDILKLKSFDINMVKEKRAKKLVRFSNWIVTDNYVRVILKRKNRPLFIF